MLLLGLLALPAGVSAQAPEEFIGTLRSTVLGAIGFAGITILVDEYTTDMEAQEFFELLANEGWQALSAGGEGALHPRRPTRTYHRLRTFDPA